ncbi:hypothetical protein K438DRAFT_1771936 [Mycena galopus ATCC 62051]|nr:hypothetical protein K438DRAFT_1771936 [Mycena galopus ATCC 62051]
MPVAKTKTHDQLTVSATMGHDRSLVLYQDILEAQSREEPSLVDLPTELVISILILAASSSQHGLSSCSRFPVDLRSYTGSSVQTLWISTNAGRKMERTIIPGIVEGCSNLTALACQYGALVSSLESALDPQHRQRSRPFQLTLIEKMGRYSPAWDHILQSPLNPSFLRNLTHLRGGYFQAGRELPLSHLPSLTHFAIGPPVVPRDYPPPRPEVEIRLFAHELDRLSLRLTQAVLVLRPHGPRMRKGPQFSTVPWHTRELVQTARDCSTHSTIMIYCTSDSLGVEILGRRRQCREDIWSLAEKQMALYP